MVPAASDCFYFIFNFSIFLIIFILFNSGPGGWLPPGLSLTL
nr:MAG TPA: hypothetical protein [Caudoviricetes sp.]